MNDVTILSWIEKGEIVFALLVAIGVAGEFASTLISRPIRARIEAQREAHIARLTKEAAEATLRERELEAQIQPRSLSQQQQDTVTAPMRRFSGNGFVIGSHWIDAEAAFLARQLKSALHAAGMGHDDNHLSKATVDRIGSYPEIVTGLFGGGGAPSGPQVFVGIEIQGTNEEAIRALASTLLGVGMMHVTTPEWSESSPFSGLSKVMPLSVFIGSKPIPDGKAAR
jgi:hypothetical protein